MKDEIKVVGGIGEKKSNSGTQWYQQDRIYDNKLALNISTCCQPYYLTRRERESDTMSLRIRKLVPCETTKLMGFERKDYQAMKDIEMSDMAIYHCCGDSLVVPLCALLFAVMLPMGEEKGREIIEKYIDDLVAN